MKPIPQLSEQELYYQTKRIQREKSKAFWKEFRSGLFEWFIICVVFALAALVLIMIGGGIKLAMDDHYATKDELTALNVRLQAMEARGSVTYELRPPPAPVVVTNYITTPPAIHFLTNAWLTNYSHVLTNPSYAITNLNGL